MSRLSITSSPYRHATWRRSCCEAGLDFDTAQFIVDLDTVADEVVEAESFVDPPEFEMASKRSMRAAVASTIAERPIRSSRPNGHPTTTALARLLEVQPLTEILALTPTVDQIRERAYLIYLNRAGRPGDPESDWLQAERELILERVGVGHRPPMS